MPRNVRNFWIELQVDGKKEIVATGPKNSGGGFEAKIYWRVRGAVCDVPAIIRGYVSKEGALVIEYDDFFNKPEKLVEATR